MAVTQKHEASMDTEQAQAPRVGRPAAVRPDQRTRWHDPITFAGVAGMTSLVRAAGPGLTRPLFAELGSLFARLPLNRARTRRAMRHIRWCFPNLSDQEVQRVARESARQLFLLAAEMSISPRRYDFLRWPDWIELGDVQDAVRLMLAEPTILISAHSGNWEVLGAWLGAIGLPIHSVYRPLDNLPLDAWVRRTRGALGIDLVDKFGAGERIPAILQNGEHVSFIADQDAGERGLFVPFFDRLASTYKSIGLLAIRHNISLVCGHTIRLAPAGQRSGHGGMRYRIEAVDIIRPDDWIDQPDPLFYLAARFRRAMETMIRAAPEQYLWMQKAWRSRPRFERRGEPMPSSLREKLESLPWMTPSSLERILTGAALETD